MQMKTLNNFNPFQTIIGYNLLDELKNFISKKTCIVTMDDLWKNFKSSFNNDVEVYFVNSLEEISLEKEISYFNKFDTIVGLGGGQALDIAKFFSWKCNLKLFQFIMIDLESELFFVMVLHFFLMLLSVNTFR